jgi:hypothetical protein
MNVKFEVLNTLRLDVPMCIGELKDRSLCNVKSVQRVIKELLADHVVVSELKDVDILCRCRSRYSLNPDITVNELSKLGIYVTLMPIDEE